MPEHHATAHAHAHAAQVAGCPSAPCPNGDRVVALSWGDLNPLKWLGKGASAVVTDAWKGAMTALWSAGLWILQLAFKIIDAFTTPDLSPNGPLADVLPYTFAVGAMIAALMAFVQIGAALYRRDGASLARVLVGVLQFGAVWVGYIAVAATLVTATAGLTKGLLQGLLHVDAFSGFSTAGSWPRRIDDTVVATVLGLCTVFVIFPAAIGYVLIMLVREAALLLLTATSPIAAGGLLAEGTKVWFWKSLRWFLASLMIAPLAALVLGIGVQITRGTVTGKGDKTAAAVGMAVTGAVLILIGAICPLILFRLLAFVDPGTSSGAAMRQSLAANGGLAGLIGGKARGASGGGSGASAGSGAALEHDSGGRSQGEASADTQTATRFSSLLGGAGHGLGVGMQAAGKLAATATTVGADVLGAAGVGHQAPYFGQDGRSVGTGASVEEEDAATHIEWTQTTTTTSGRSSRRGGDADGDGDGGAPPSGGNPDPPPSPQPPSPPPSPAPPSPGSGGPTGPAGGGGAVGGAAAGVPVVPV